MGVRPAWSPEYGIDLGPALEPYQRLSCVT
jgi:hypothetical protein